MATRLLERLGRAIDESSDPYQRECLNAERAAALARQGLLDEARFALAGLRTQSRRFRRPQLRAWVHLVDGLLDHFSALAPEARHKFADAQREAALAEDPRLQGLACAWMAASEFNARHFEAMADALRDALKWAAPDDHGTHARVALVLASAADLAGCPERAAGHYGDAHRHAVAEGDIAMISAMLCNRAQRQAESIVFDELLGQPRRDDALRTLIDNDSIFNLDRGLGNDALGAMAPLMRAELFTALQRWEEAADLYRSNLSRAQREGLGGGTPRYLAQRAWCLWHLGSRQQALAEADEAERHLKPACDPDDRFVAHRRLAELFDGSAAHERAARHRQAAALALQAFRAHQARLQAALDTVNLPLTA